VITFEILRFAQDDGLGGAVSLGVAGGFAAEVVGRDYF
jgi:hypothetical protein